MRKFFTTLMFLVLIGGSVAMAQTRTPAAANKPSIIRKSPMGHRQPRANQVPSEKKLGNPNNLSNTEDAVLDRKIKSICRGC